MTEDFNKWWDADQGYDGVANPYRSDSAAYWAWEGWQAGAAAERWKIKKDIEEEMTDELDDQAYHLCMELIAKILKRGTP